MAASLIAAGNILSRLLGRLPRLPTCLGRCLLGELFVGELVEN